MLSDAFRCFQLIFIHFNVQILPNKHILNHEKTCFAGKDRSARTSQLAVVGPDADCKHSTDLGNTESFEPYTQNLYVRRVLSGEFVQVNRHLLKDLITRGLWNDETRMKLIAHNGSVQRLDLPQDLKDLYKTVWEIKQRRVLDMAADRGAYIDQSQSLNLSLESALSCVHAFSV